MQGFIRSESFTNNNNEGFIRRESFTNNNNNINNKSNNTFCQITYGTVLLFSTFLWSTALSSRKRYSVVTAVDR